MSKEQDHFVRYQIRVPEELYQQIEAIAIRQGAKLHPRTKRPQLSETIIELLQLALRHFPSTQNPQFPSKKSLDLEFIQDWIARTQKQQSQQLKQQLHALTEAQQQTQAELYRLNSLYHQLCDRLNIPKTEEKTGYPDLSPQQIHPLESYSAGPWMVNRQWLSLNGCFNEEAFTEWDNGEIRQDQRGNFWQRVDLASADERFQIPSSLAKSHIFYVLAE